MFKYSFKAHASRSFYEYQFLIKRMRRKIPDQFLLGFEMYYPGIYFCRIQHEWSADERLINSKFLNQVTNSLMF